MADPIIANRFLENPQVDPENSREFESVMAQIKSLAPEERQKYIDEVSRWILYRDYNPETWYAKAQKALLQEVYILRKKLKDLNS